MSQFIQDLHEIAEALSHVPTPFQVEYKRLLIRAGRKAILPLVTSVVTSCNGRRDLLEIQARYDSFTTQEDKEVLPYAIAQSYINHIAPHKINVITELIPQLGKFAYSEIFSLLSHTDHKVRLVAALIIASDTHISPELRDIIELFVDALDETDYEPKTALWVVRVGLAKQGSKKWKAVIDQIAAEKQGVFDEFADEAVHAAILQLTDLEDLVNEELQ